MNMFGNSFQENLRKIQSNPKEFLQQMGVNVPEEMMNNPQAIVMHLLQTGQVSGPLAQRIMPMMRMMGINR